MLPNQKDDSLAMSGLQHIGTGWNTEMCNIHSVWLVRENVKLTQLFLPQVLEGESFPGNRFG